MNKKTIKLIVFLKKNLGKIPLTERERSILDYRFGVTNNNFHTLHETGIQFGITRERVRQIQVKAVTVFEELQNT